MCYLKNNVKVILFDCYKVIFLKLFFKNIIKVANENYYEHFFDECLLGFHLF